MPGVRALSWPWMFSRWELHRVVGMRTWEGEQKREGSPRLKGPPSRLGTAFIVGREALSEVEAELGWDQPPGVVGCLPHAVGLLITCVLGAGCRYEFQLES